MRAAQDAFGSQAAADAIEGLFATLSATLAARGVRRFVVAGGETSGAVVKGLQAVVLNIGPRAAAGVPLVQTRGLALALKSGTFGGPAFFRETLKKTETAG
ncbi:nucleotide-binding domain containing protein [Pseudooctadecabacter jejudonensis]|uniref:nucleotide-binding domain containing protein n=1 Tax=Pseudooctadecabacter jejudonensis TaxID=1391910 RepID=UPI001F418BB7|nr:nucleotide-binding domain containing protein [Pseudooctadecabacter jejudonensis]